MPPEPEYNYEPTDTPVAMTGDLATVRQLFVQMKRFEDEAAELEAQASKATAKANHIAEVLLPSLMSNIGLDEFKTSDGKVVKLVDKVQAGITEANADKAFSWLRSVGQGEIIRRTMKLDFGPGDPKAAKALEALAELNVIPATDKEGVHHATLAKTIKDLVAADESVPLELFGARIFKRAEEKATRKKTSF